MKSIKICLMSFFLFTIFGNLSAQNDFYNDEKKPENIQATEKKELLNEDTIIEQYYTESDYKAKNNVSKTEEVIQNDQSEVLYEDEMYDDEIYEDRRSQRRNNVAGEAVAEIFVDVIVNTAFIIATFWH